jgi:hypothetical protein
MLHQGETSMSGIFRGTVDLFRSRRLCGLLCGALLAWPDPLTAEEPEFPPPPVLAFAPGDSPAPEVPDQKKPGVPLGIPAANSCLPELKHFSEMPAPFPGINVALSRYLRFVTPEGRAVHARMFLLEAHMDRAEFPDVPKAIQEKRRNVPSRFMAIGHEIAVGNPLDFKPDFDVPVQYVKAAGRCQYDVNLGSLTVHVRTTD